MRHVVMFSSGAGSWAAARRVVDQHGTADVVLLFADTLIEDEDNYRFLDQAATDVGAPLVKIADGRTPWQVFRDERFLGNTRADPCSKILKRNLLDKWLTDNRDPKGTIVYVGIDWTEEHRLTKLRERRALDGWDYRAPMCDPPYVSKAQVLASMVARGLAPPRLYALGFPHANCGGGCVKAGQAQFKLLLEALPERYRHWEEQEELLRVQLGDVSILRDRRGGKTKPLPLAQFRRTLEAKGEVDVHEWGGCGCAVDV